MKKIEIKKLDKLWSAKIRARGRCEVCNKTTHLNAHHYIGRRNRNVRWDLDNGVCLCSGCHTMKAESAHQNPEWFRTNIIAMRGFDWLDRLMAKSRVDCMAQKQDYEEIKESLERQ
jgi:hypothetical protein